MHHLHCVARPRYVEAAMSPDIIGTICWYRIDDPVVADGFDWLDLSNEHQVKLGPVESHRIVRCSAHRSLPLSLDLASGFAQQYPEWLYQLDVQLS